MTREILMPNEKIDSEEVNFPGPSDFDPEKTSEIIARKNYEPTEGLYKGEAKLKNDPFRAIEAVKLIEKSESGIKDCH